MKKYLNFPVLILSASIIRPIIYGANLADALVIFALSLLYSGYYYLESKKEPVANKDLINRIVELEEQIRITKEMTSSLKLGASLKR